MGYVVLHFQFNKAHLILSIFSTGLYIHTFKILVSVRKADYLQLHSINRNAIHLHLCSAFLLQLIQMFLNVLTLLYFGSKL